MRARHVSRSDSCAPADISGNPFDPRQFNLRADIVQHRPGDLAGTGGREQHGHQPAQRGADRDESLDPLIGEQSHYVTNIDQRIIGRAVLGIVAQSAPAHFGHDHAPVCAEVLCQWRKIARIPGQAVHAENRQLVRRRLLGSRIIAIVQRQAVGAGPVAVAIGQFHWWFGSSNNVPVWWRSARLRFCLAVATIAGCAPNRKPPFIGPIQQS